MEELFTPERRAAFEKFLDTLVKLDEYGLLDAVNGLVDPELIGRLAEILITPSTLKLLDRVDELVGLLGEVDVDAVKSNVGTLKAVLEALQKEPKPVGLAGLLRALSDPEVQRGLGVAIEVLKALGRASQKK